LRAGDPAFRFAQRSQNTLTFTGPLFLRSSIVIRIGAP
jgi:hypothetical protein